MQPAQLKPAAALTVQLEENSSAKAAKPGSKRITIAQETIGLVSLKGNGKKEKKDRISVKGSKKETSVKVEAAKDVIMLAKPRTENDTSPRSSSSGSKSDTALSFDISAHDPLADYSVDYLARLEPQKCKVLLSYCQERIDIDPNAKIICERIEKIQKDRMNQGLLDAIIKNDELRLAILLDNSTLIETEELFTAIKDAIESCDPQHSERKRKLIVFCQQWIAENRSTKSLVKAQPIFKEIVSICQRQITDQTSKEDKEVRIALAGIVERGLKPIQKPPFVSPFAADSGYEQSMEEILKQIKTTELTTNTVESKFASKVALDLQGHQALLFLDIAAQDFVSKYKETPASIERSVRFFNALSEYAAETVVSCTMLIERLRLMRFFLLVARNLRKLGDFQSLGAICAGICGDVTVARLKKTWKELEEKSTEMKELIFEMDSLADASNNHKNLRDAIAAHPDQMKFIPYLILIHKQLTNLNDIGMKVIGDEYNLHRALDGRALRLKALETQTKVRPQNARPFSNIVSACLNNFPTTKEECEARETARLERSKLLEPPNLIVP